MAVSVYPRTRSTLARRLRFAGGPPRQARSAVSSARASGGPAGTPGPYLTRSPGTAATSGSTGAPAGCDAASAGGCEGSPAAPPNRGRVTGSWPGASAPAWPAAPPNRGRVTGSWPGASAPASPAVPPNRGRVTGSWSGTTVPGSPLAALGDDPGPVADSQSPIWPTFWPSTHGRGEASWQLVEPTPGPTVNTLTRVAG